VKGDSFDVTESDAGLSITSQSKLSLMVPSDASLTIERVHGDCVIKNVNGDISLQEVSGDSVLAGVGSAKLNIVHSDLSAKNVSGALSAEIVHGDTVLRNVGDVALNHVYGDVSARFVNGSAQLDEVMGDIGLRTVNGDITINRGYRDANFRNLGGKVMVENIQGDIRLYGGLSAAKHAFTAEGDIILRWPVDAPLNLTATAPKIVNRLYLDKVVESDNTLTGQIENGETFLSLTANGRIVLKDVQAVSEEWDMDQGDDLDFDFAFDLDKLGERISTQVNEQVARVTATLETKFGPDFTKRLEEKIARKAERAAEKAERAAERARHQAEQKMRQTRWYGPRPVTPPTPPTPPSPKKKASNEEQLKILRMVEKGIITPDEANTLLEALES
jgi:DUF4097 and DUF4098 domain-containing protein YvlB